MKKIFSAIVGCILILSASQSLATTSRPCWSLFSETAYNLKQGQWNTDLIGWASYGLSSRFQMGTNGILDIVQIPNFYGQFVLIEETETAPQVALGGSLYYPLAVNTPISTDLSINIARAIDSGNYILHAGIKQTTNINDTAVSTTNPINTPGLGFKAGIITNQSDTSHFYVEAYSNWIPIGRSAELAVGTDFVNGNQTISFGGLFYAADTMDRRANFLPFVNVQWML